MNGQDNPKFFELQKKRLMLNAYTKNAQIHKIDVSAESLLPVKIVQLQEDIQRLNEEIYGIKTQ